MSFSAPIERYEAIKLDLDKFTDWTALPPGYRFVPEHELDRDAERELLQSEFSEWERPFHRREPGYIPEGVVAVAYERELIGIGYFVTENIFGMEGYVQGHYAVVRPEHRGRRLFAAMVSEMFSRLRQRGPRWKGLVLETDRAGHREMYEHWGGEFISDTPKNPKTGN